MRTVVAFGGEFRELKKFGEALVHTRRGRVCREDRCVLLFLVLCAMIPDVLVFFFWRGVRVRARCRFGVVEGGQEGPRKEASLSLR